MKITLAPQDGFMYNYKLLFKFLNKYSKQNLLIIYNIVKNLNNLIKC